MTKVVQLSQATLSPASPQYYDIFEFSDRKVKVNIKSLTELIINLGFRTRDGMLIRVQNSIIEEIKDPQEIHRYIYEHVKTLEDYEFIHKDVPYKVSRHDFIAKWMAYAVKFNFAKNAILSSIPTYDVPALRDKKDKIFIAFKNGILVITKNKTQLIPYSEINRVCIWKSQIADVEINLRAKKGKSQYSKFIYNLSGRDKSNEQKIHYALGYLMHNYSIQSKSKIVLLYDKTKKKGKQGGVGKDLLLQGISYIRRCTILDGKNWKLHGSNDFFYQSVTPDTQVIIISDPEYQSQFNDLFVKSQGPLIVNRKFRDELFIDRKNVPKFAITSNVIFDASDASNKRRQLPLIIDGYYRDMGVEQPIVKEHGSEFYDEWSKEEWNKFYLTIIEIAQSYLSMPTPRIEFDGLIRQRFENKYGLMGKYIIDLTTPKCPKLISNKEALDQFVESYIDIDNTEEGKKDYHDLSVKFGEAIMEWFEVCGIEYEKRRVKYKADDGRQLKQVVYRIMDKTKKPSSRALKN